MSTIAALSTPPGRSAIAVVRLSGPKSLNIVARLTTEGTFSPRPREATLRTIRDPHAGEVLDQVLITYMPAPNSFTGEEMVELSCHGSPIILRRIIDVLLDHGARLADPGEFTLRALANGKMDLSQAEAIRDLINARSEAAAQQAIRQLGGALSLRLQPLKDSIIRVIVRLESALEFVEDDLPALESETIVDSLRKVIEELRTLSSTFHSGHWLRDGIKVTIAGRPNVGKSSLFNRLLVTDRAIVTEIPGTTRDTLSETISISGIPIVLTDTAGVRGTSDKIESIGIDRAQQAIADADLVLLVVDGSTELNEDDWTLFSQADDSRYLVVVNKSDLPGFKGPGGGLGPSERVSISALRGDGLDEVCKAIVRRVGFADLSNEGFLVTDARHYDLLGKSRKQVEAAVVLFEGRASEELVLVGLHNALTLLGAITGETTTEDILSEIFSTFCIGK
jgi:tRNA modification GTPase